MEKKNLQSLMKIQSCYFMIHSSKVIQQNSLPTRLWEIQVMIYSRGERIKVTWVALGVGQEMGGMETEVRQKKGE